MKKSANNFCIKTGYFDFHGKYSIIIYTLKRVSSPPLWLSDTINPNRCSVIIAQQGGMDRHCPLLVQAS
jgi:hypothetical protein